MARCQAPGSTTSAPTALPLQVGDIGLMGAPAKLDGKAVEGYKIFLGGKIGENPELATQFEQVRTASRRGCTSFLLSHGKSILVEDAVLGSA